jgi:hypothetical protein
MDGEMKRVDVKGFNFLRIWFSDCFNEYTDEFSGSAEQGISLSAE